MFCIKQFCFLTEKKKSDFTRRYLNTQDTIVHAVHALKTLGFFPR